MSGDANYCPEAKGGKMPPGAKKMNAKLAEGDKITYVDGTALVHYGGACSESSCCCGCCCACCCPMGTKSDLRVEIKPNEYEYTDIKCPIHLIHGEKDDTADSNCARYLASQIPTSRVTIVPNCGHVQLPAEIFDKAMDELHAAALLSPGQPAPEPAMAR